MLHTLGVVNTMLSRSLIAGGQYIFALYHCYSCTIHIGRFWRAKQFGAQSNLARKTNDINESNYGGMIETVQHSMIGEGRMG